MTVLPCRVWYKGLVIVINPCIYLKKKNIAFHFSLVLHCTFVSILYWFWFFKKGINCEVEMCRLLSLTNLWNLDYRSKTISIEIDEVK